MKIPYTSVYCSGVSNHTKKTCYRLTANFIYHFTMRLCKGFYPFFATALSFAAAVTGTDPLGSSPTSSPTFSSHLIMSRATDAGQGCSGSEGMWNCMTTSFQRCAAGRWSDIMQCAAGTQCSPAGTGYDFNVGFSNGGGVESGAEPQFGKWEVWPTGCVLSLALLACSWLA